MAQADAPTRTVRSERLEARITPRQKALLQRAADLEGTTLTEFVVRSAQKAAEASILTHASLALTERETSAFIESLLNPPQPNTALRAAARRHQETLEDR